MANNFHHQLTVRTVIEPALIGVLGIGMIMLANSWGVRGSDDAARLVLRLAGAAYLMVGLLIAVTPLHDHDNARSKNFVVAAVIIASGVAMWVATDLSDGLIFLTPGIILVGQALATKRQSVDKK